MNGRKPLAVNQSCIVSIFPRLHVTLIGMNDDGYRLNGGVGFCIDEPRAKVCVSTASEFSLHDNRRWPLQLIEQSRLANIAQNFAMTPLRVEISGEMPSHCGFGSATGIRLATLEAIATLMCKSIDRVGLIQASGRGGTSGIGVTTYFDGGLVLDVGVKYSRMELLPSSALEGVRLSPLIITQVEMPSWKIGLCVPSGIPLQTEEQEITFFKRACPISAADANEALYHALYGTVASARARDFKTFCNAIKAIQHCTFKRLERELNGRSLMLIEEAIYEAGASAVGMSSLGPGLFFLADDVDTIATKLQTALPQHKWMVTGCYNSGRTLIS